MRDYFYCWYHYKYEQEGKEPFVCFECKHIFNSEQEMLTAHNVVLKEIGIDRVETNISHIECCPYCAHDF